MGRMDRVQAVLGRQPKVFLTGGAAALALFAWVCYAPPLRAIRRSAEEWNRIEREQVQSREVLETVRRGKVPLLRSADDTSAILSELGAEIRAHQLQLIQISPGISEPSGKGMLMFPIEFAIEGEYRPIGEFLGSLRQAPPFGAVFVRRVSIAKNQAMLPRLRAYVTIHIALERGSSGTWTKNSADY